jgi:ABC-2 type transport system permease protein
VKFRDIGPIWEVFSQILFYITPIVWPLSMVLNNHKIPEWVAKLIMLNPFAQIIQDLRFTLIQPIAAVQTVWSTFHVWYLQIIPIVIVLVLFIFAILFFKKQSKNFAEEV